MMAGDRQWRGLTSQRRPAENGCEHQDRINKPGGLIRGIGSFRISANGFRRSAPVPTTAPATVLLKQAGYFAERIHLHRENSRQSSVLSGMKARGAGQGPAAVTQDLVRAEGLEPPQLSSLEPKSSASTNSATPAKRAPCLAAMPRAAIYNMCRRLAAILRYMPLLAISCGK